MIDYRGFLTRCSTNGEGDRIADIAVDVIKNVSQAPRLQRLTGGDPDDINDAIDAQLDRLIVACDGDMRLALFNVATTAGAALTALLGPHE